MMPSRRLDSKGRVQPTEQSLDLTRTLLMNCTLPAKLLTVAQLEPGTIFLSREWEASRLCIRMRREQRDVAVNQILTLI